METDRECSLSLPTSPYTLETELRKEQSSRPHWGLFKGMPHDLNLLAGHTMDVSDAPRVASVQPIQRLGIEELPWAIILPPSYKLHQRAFEPLFLLVSFLRLPPPPPLLSKEYQLIQVLLTDPHQHAVFLRVKFDYLQLWALFSVTESRKKGKLKTVSTIKTKGV